MVLNLIRGIVLCSAICALAFANERGQANDGTKIEIPVLPLEQVYELESGCKIIGIVEEKDLSLKPKQHPSKWTGECRDGLAHGKGTRITQYEGKTYYTAQSVYFGRLEQSVFPGNIGINNDRFTLISQNVDPATNRAPAQFPPDPNYAALLANLKPELLKYSLEHSVLKPYINIEDKVSKEEHGLMIMFSALEPNLYITHKINGKNSGRTIKCSSLDVTTACSREWNEQFDAFWKKAQPLYDRAMKDAVATRDFERRKIDVLMEPMRVALGQSYTGTPFTSEELAWAQQMRNARAVKVATAAENDKQALAVVEQKAALEKQQRAALESEAGLRREAYAALPAAKTAGVSLAAKPFAAPLDASKAAVMIIEYSSNSRFQLDTGMLELPTGVEPIFVAPNDQAEIDAATEKLKTEGYSTLYVIDLTRWQTWKAPVSAKISNAVVTVSSSVRDNPEYPILMAQLREARQELAVAKAEYDRTNAQANSGGYGRSTAGVVSGIFAAVSDGSAYSNAQTKVLRLEEALARTDPKIRTVSKANVGFADSKFTSVFSGRVGVAACDLILSRCAERERVIESSITLDQPLVLIQGDPEYARRIAEDKTATAELKKQRDGYGQIGFSTNAMGKYVDGLPMFVPISQLAAWQKFAFEDFNKRFDQRQAALITANTALAKQLVPLAATLKGVKFDDPTGAIREAEEKVATEERRKNVQGLE
jgi:hypothetical protein